MKRILLLIPSLAGAGGTERMVHALSGLFTRAGCEVHQASFDPPDTPRHFNDQTPFHALGPIPKLPLPVRPIAYAIAAWRLRKLKHSLNVDITISNLWGADLISALSGGLGRRIALCHINLIGNKSNRMMLRLLPIVRAVYRRFDHVVAVNETLADELRSLYRLDDGQLTHINNFSDKPEVEPQWPDDDGVCRFVWCGRFSHEKNVGGLLRAWAEFSLSRPGTQLLLIGDGPEQAEARELAGSLGLSVGTNLGDPASKVLFVGKVDEPARLILGARALVLSSRVEGLPMVVLEALTLGTPVLATDCPAGGVRAALSGRGHFKPDRREAEFTPAGALLPIPQDEDSNSIALWKSALDLASSDPAVYAAWCSGALERAQHFSSSTAMEKWMKLIDSEGTLA